jgi:amino-acid N-acetyltransferase
MPSEKALILLKFRKATVSDIKNVHKLINSLAKKGQMLPRSLNELYEHIRDLFLAEENGELIGVCALHLLWEDLAEIRSLAVMENHRRKRVGSRLVHKCVQEARNIGVKRLFALTYAPEFFYKTGFKEIDKSVLPQKIWGDCLKCHKFPECDEVAVLREI